MPTGYTAGIEDGSITTFREYALKCARAFGALVHQRDDSLDTEIVLRTPDEYLAQSLARAKRRKSEWEKMTLEEKKLKYNKEKTSALEEHTKSQQKTRRVLDRYNAIRAQVTAWNPPTADHFELRKFMLEQIDSSTKYMDEILHPFKYQSFRDWCNTIDGSIQGDVIYYTDQLEKNGKQVESANTWIKQLMGSL